MWVKFELMRVVLLGSGRLLVLIPFYIVYLASNESVMLVGRGMLGNTESYKQRFWIQIGVSIFYRLKLPRTMLCLLPLDVFHLAYGISLISWILICRGGNFLE